MSQYGFLFDLDGVIVDTAKYHFLAWKRLADELDIPFTEQDNERLKGVSRMASLEIILEIGNRTMTEDEKQALCQRKNDWYVEYIKKLEKSENLPEDLVKDNQDKIQKLTDKYTGIIDKSVADKEKEVMTV